MTTKSNTSSSASGGIGFCGLLTIAFIVLKLTKVIAWSWWMVFAPLWAPAVLVLTIIAVIFAIALLAEARK